MKRIKLLFYVLAFVSLSSCESQINKVNGVSFVAQGKPVNNSHTQPTTFVNANFAALMPFGFIRDLNNPKLIFNTERQWFGERSDGVKQYTEELRKYDIKIMIKPQIWIRGGEFTGFLKMNTEDDWKTLEKSYSNFILEYARLAEEIDAEILCIGTELEKFIENRPDYWGKLILEIKAIYKGKLTYAANWDEFKRTPFWDKLDFIGIDAYFPVSNHKTPTVEDCIAGWQKHKTTIKTYSDKYQKQILFTEYGYRSVDFTGKEPWNYDHNMIGVNLQAQVNAYEALYQSFWDEDWFAGGFIWKWFIDHEKVGGDNNNQFTPQNKPVMKVIKRYYKKT